MSMQTQSHGQKDELQTVEREVTALTEDYSDQFGQTQQPSLIPTTELLQMLVRQQQIETDREQRRWEHERHLKELEQKQHREQLEQATAQHQEEMRSMTEFLTRITEQRSQPQLKPPKLKAIQGGDRIDSYLIRFKQHMTTYNVLKDEWPEQLRALLEDYALTAFLALTAMEARDYDLIKTALHERMRITAETKQKHWWEATIKPNQTATQ